MNFLKNHKEAASEEESEGTWAVSYGDMITLLLSFFVIFYNTDFEKEKTLKINHHLGFSIDSLKLRIPFDKVTILNESILDEKTKIIVSNVSGEIISEDKIKSLTTEIKFNL